MSQDIHHVETPPRRRGPGAQLRQARVDLRLAPEEAAKILHLSARQILALEADDYDNLPGPTYVRGYLRGYAQILGLSPDSIVDAYNELPAASRPVDLGKLSPPQQVTSRHHTVKLATLLVAGIIISLVALWWQGREVAVLPPTVEAPVVLLPPSAEGTDSTTVVLPSAKPAPTAPAAAVESPPAAPAGKSANAEKAAAAPEKAAADNQARTPPRVAPAAPPPAPAAAAPAVPATPRAPVVASPTPRAPETVPFPDTDTEDDKLGPPLPRTPRSRLVLQAVDESWADIRDARGNRLLYENVPPGRTVTLEGVPPFNVFLGNVDGVRIEYNGKPYDATQHRRGPVARFTLGEAPRATN